MIKEIYRNYGLINGFYAGFIPSAARHLIKQIYRWPLMLVLPEFFKSVYPDSVKKKYRSIAKISTGLSLAVIDTFIVCPFERLKVCLQTRKGDLSMKQFFVENRGHLTSSLFRGLSSLFIRQMMSWVSFLYFDHTFKHMAREYKGLREKDPLDNKTIFGVSILVGLINVFVVMPFDMTKTLYQQHSERFSDKKLTQTIKHVYKTSGMRGFYSGWQPRLIQYMIHSIFSVAALEKMEQKIKDSS